MANKAIRPDHLLAIPQGARRIEELIHLMVSDGYDDMVVNVNKLCGDFEQHFASELGLDREAAGPVLERLMGGFGRAIRATDWRLGYRRFRDDATIPEVAVNMIVAATRLLANAFSSAGVQSYRNREAEFLCALAEFSEEANGSPIANMDFYQRLGKQVAEAVLDHRLTGLRPELTPHRVFHKEIAEAALTQLVYFIQCGHEGPIKIGIARDPKARLANLQTGHHEPLQLRAITDGGAERERDYHARFTAHALRGEWFSPAPEILAEIDRLRAQTPSQTQEHL